MSRYKIRMQDGVVVDAVPLRCGVVYCSEEEPPHYTWFLVPSPIKDQHRKVVIAVLAAGFQRQMPEKAYPAAKEAVRLMEEDAEDLVNGYMGLYFTTTVSNLAWMSVGVPPELGDIIAEQRDKDDSTHRAPGRER